MVAVCDKNSSFWPSFGLSGSSNVGVGLETSKYRGDVDASVIKLARHWALLDVSRQLAIWMAGGVPV
jgi:hypothetical protein